MSGTAGGGALTRLLDVYRRLQVHHAHLVHEQSVALGVNQTDLRFLFFLDAEAPEGLLPKAATHYLGLSTGATTTLVDRLEARQLVTRIPNPDDRRSVYVRISDAGREVVGTSRAQYLDAFREAIPAEDAERFTELLAAFDSAVVRRTAGADESD